MPPPATRPGRISDRNAIDSIELNSPRLARDQICQPQFSCVLVSELLKVRSDSVCASSSPREIGVLVGCGGLEPLTPRKTFARRSEVGRGASPFAFARARRSHKASGYRANLYSQAGAVGGGARRDSNTARALGRRYAEVGTDFRPKVEVPNPPPAPNGKDMQQ
jgi:hypothetical protein